jgi:hypothetical protein
MKNDAKTDSTNLNNIYEGSRIGKFCHLKKDNEVI